jgi:TrmH family RNA methyltransferase
LISSRANPTVKKIRALRDRKARDESGRFFVEGIRIVGEAGELEADVEICVVAPDLLSSPYGAEVARRLGERVTLLEVSADVFRSISTKEGPQGIGAVIRQTWGSLQDIDPAGDFCWVALDAVQDPGNVGSIVRTSDAVGGAGIILLGAGTDPHDPSALRAGMGAVFSQRMVRATFEELALWTRRNRCVMVGTSGSASVDYQSVCYRSPAVLLMGSEREGLSEEQLAVCDAVVSIPMAGRSDSLNLAVATGVILYEMFNQERI